jgi:DNA-directed RNA polymerase specialized sigma24 family protein
MDAITSDFLRAINGDERAAASLYTGCFPAIAASLARRVADGIAFEAAHDALVLGLTRGARLRLRGPVFPWLRTVALRLALKRIRGDQRRARRERDYYDASKPCAARPGGDSRLALLAACLQAIPERQRVLVERHYFANEPSAAIARSQNRTRAAVAVELHRICRALRRQIEERAGVGMAA